MSAPQLYIMLECAPDAARLCARRAEVRATMGDAAAQRWHDAVMAHLNAPWHAQHTARKQAQLLSTLKFWALLVLLLMPIFLAAHALIAPPSWYLSPHLMMHAMRK